MFGGGAGGGSPMTGIDRRGVTPRCACCLKKGIDGLWCMLGLVDARLLGTKDGVLDMARTGPATGRDEERNGAGSERIWTLVGRRSGCEGGIVLVASICGEDVAEGGLAGVVTERLTTMPSGMGAGPREEKRRGTTRDPSVCCACGRTGKGRRNGFGFCDIRVVGCGVSVAAVDRPPTVD